MSDNKTPHGKLEESRSAETTEGVDILTGDPKSAILKLSIPVMLAMLLSSSYNVVNAIWVAGLGSDELAAIGFITPIFMILIGLGSGISAGASSSISRWIGKSDHSNASNAAIHTLIITLIISVLVTIPLVIFAEPISSLFGAGSLSGIAASYGTILFGGAIFIIFSNSGYGIFRAEGDSKRTMYAMAAGAVLNMILDPVLIYGMNLGVAGAAWGTVISCAIVSLIMCYWFFVKKSTYVQISKKMFTPSRDITQDILIVGLPASVEFLALSILNIILNFMLVILAGSDAVAVISVGFRVSSYGIVPIIALGSVVVSVTGAAYGARLYKKNREIILFSLLFGLGISIFVGIVTRIFAYPIASIFSYSASSATLYPTIAAFLGVMCLFYPIATVGILSASVYQGVGKGPTSLILTIIRSLVLVAIFAYVFAFGLNMGEIGVWWGLIVGEGIGSLFAFSCLWRYISHLLSCTNRAD